MASSALLSGHRVESYWVDLLTLQDVPMGRLDGVTGGTVTQNVNATIRGGGSLDYSGALVDWSQFHVQPWFRAVSGGDEIVMPLGVFLARSPGTSYRGASASASLQLFDKLYYLDSDTVGSTYQVPAGANVTDWIRSMLIGIGEHKIAIEDSTEKLSTRMSWDVNTSKLRIINDLLEAIHYFSLWVDGYGVFRADPYKRPQDRAVEAVLEDGRNAIYVDQFEHEYDTWEVYNKIRCIGQTNGEDDPLVAEAIDYDGPFGFHARGGKWWPYTYDGVDATSQQALQGIAQRRLVESQDVLSKYAVEHAPIDVKTNDVVLFRNRVHGIEASCTVQKMDWTLRAGSVVASELREIAA